MTELFSQVNLLFGKKEGNIWGLIVCSKLLWRQCDSLFEAYNSRLSAGESKKRHTVKLRE